VTDSKFSLVDLGEWSKPVTTLIERCSEAVGGLFAPHRVRRIARAHANADKTHAIAQIEITDIQRRAVRRWIAEEGKKQENMEEIVRKALPEVKEDALPGEVNDDWLTNFFDKARLISDEQMQTLWARILAGEANTPRCFSKKTVNLVANLDKDDAKLFSILCRFIMDIGGPTVAVLSAHHPIYTEAGLNFGGLMHLEYTALIQLDVAASYYKMGLPKTTTIRYFGEPITVAFQQDSPQYQLNVGCAVLTQAGRELAPLCDVEPHDGFIDFATEYWKRYSITLERSAKA